jgi:pyruvate/2-oxoglutarate/acetoin dehydrogenase E1 component
VIDLRTLSPLDMAVVDESVQKTGRVVTVHEAQLNLGLGAELAARITEHASIPWRRRAPRGGIRHALPAEPGRRGVPS